MTVGGFRQADIEPVFQPIFDLLDLTVVGYEALARGRNGDAGLSPEALFALAREQGRVTELDRACREAALACAQERGLAAPFSLFVNADAGALVEDPPDTPPGDLTLIMEVTERALTDRPEPLLRALTRLRTLGWGIALDDVGADSRSLALMPVLYPDVIKLDLRLLLDRSPEDVARVVTAVGAEAEHRMATVLAEGIDSEAQLATARAAGATLGQGFFLGPPAPLPDELPEPGRRLRLTSSGGIPDGAVPYQRVTNWKRPRTAPRAGGAHRRAAVRAGLRARRDGPPARRRSRRRRGAAGPGRALPPAGRRHRLRGLARRRGARHGGRSPRRPAGGRRPAARHLDRGRARPGLRRLLRRRARRTASGCSPPPTTTRPWSSARCC